MFSFDFPRRVHIFSNNKESTSGNQTYEIDKIFDVFIQNFQSPIHQKKQYTYMKEYV